MKEYFLYKQNRIDKGYTISFEELSAKFKEWMKTKEKDWLEYYCHNLVPAFVTEKSGLDSSFNSTDSDKLTDDLKDVKWEYLNSIGIK